jgi:predicted outer membrane repeat protein
MLPNRLHTVLWLAFSAMCASAQSCPKTPVPTTVLSTADAATLAKQLAAAFDCPKAAFSAVWQGSVTLTESFVVGNGTSLIVRGTATDKAIINGNGTVQLFIVRGELSLSNITLTNGSAADFGGAILTGPSAKLNIADSVFSNNNAAKSGGAIAVGNDTTTVITGCTFDMNTAVAAAGGCIAANFTSTLLISNSNFSNSAANRTGGAISSDANTTVTISDSTFRSNKAQYGGSISVNSSSALTIGACNLTLSGSTFTNNSAVKLGGAVYTDPNNTIAVSGSNFSFNTADYGGSIYSSTATNRAS